MSQVLFKIETENLGYFKRKILKYFFVCFKEMNPLSAIKHFVQIGYPIFKFCLMQWFFPINFFLTQKLIF